MFSDSDWNGMLFGIVGVGVAIGIGISLLVVGLMTASTECVIV